MTNGRALLFRGAALLAALAGCAPGADDYWASLEGMDAAVGDTDSDADTDGDTDTDSDGDTDECDEDATTCGDGGPDTDTLTPEDAGPFCDSPQFAEFLAAPAHEFDNTGAPYRGTAADAEVVITGFSYFYCPHCATAAAMLEELFEDPDVHARAAYHFRHYVFDLTSESFGCSAHRAAEAAHQQGLFFDMHDALFAFDEVVLTEEQLFDMAEAIGCEMGQFADDYDAAETLARIVQDKAVGQDAGVSGTPSLFVDGKRVVPWSLVPQVVECLLETADAGLDAGLDAAAPDAG